MPSPTSRVPTQPRPLARKSRSLSSKRQAPSNPIKAKAIAPAAMPTKQPEAAVLTPEKGKKPKLVRDGFTMPKDEFARIDVIKQRAARGGHPVKKSEVLRAGLAMLASLDDKALLAQLRKIPALKTGRPRKA